MKNKNYIFNGTEDLVEFEPNAKMKYKKIGSLYGVKFKTLPIPKFINKYKTKLWKLNKSLEEIVGKSLR